MLPPSFASLLEIAVIASIDGIGARQDGLLMREGTPTNPEPQIRMVT